MSDTKQDVLDMLRDLTELTLLDEADPQSFRVRAYENATQAIAAQASDLGRLSLKDLRKIDGVGKSISEKISEFLQTGRVQKLEHLRQKYPRSLLELLRIQGLGPKAVIRLRSELGVQSLEDLRRVLADHKLRELKGFGAKSEEKLSLALTRLEEQGSLKRTPISVALPHAERIVAELRALPGVSHAAYCGSLRRFSETVGDIDIVVAASDPKPVMDAVVGLRLVDHVLAHGETKTSIVTQRGIQVDVRVVRAQNLGAALLYFTGSKSHNVKLRQRALKRGWTLNEYALTELTTDKVIASETESQIYEALGLAYIPAILREDLGELDFAERGTLPRAMGAPRGDFHVHTNVSGDGRASLEEMVSTARARGYAVLAITDHAEGTVSGVDRQALLAQRERIRTLQQELGDTLTLLHGVELNIGPQGELDYDPEFRAGFDFCIASVHSHFTLDQGAQTARVIRAMQEPSVRMIGHLTARMIGGRAPIALDFAAVFACAEQTGTALEINGALPRLDVSVDVLRQARDNNVTFVLTSDAHSTDELTLIDFAARNAERAWLDPARVANTWPLAQLREWARPRP